MKPPPIMESPVDQVKPIIGIVDDDESIRRALRRLIQSMGLHPETFASSEDFMQHGDRDKIACLLLDVQLPGMSGFELWNQLAASGSRIPAIFISSHRGIEARGPAKESGAVAYLEKPFDDYFLLELIRVALRRRRRCGKGDGIPEEVEP